jgi:2-polyprenyl-3-methyl-5-hydroxy-6-metoxy-1,4-benzoquinol methylase
VDVALVEILRCPQTRERLILQQPQYSDGLVRAGQLMTQSGRQCYLIRDFIPRFVGDSNYADNFGLQWNSFRQTQLDSHSGQGISASRFWKSTGWRPSELAGQHVLDAGCGAGRFAEVALSAGATVVALDYSSAVDACYRNLKHYRNLHVIQGDINALPFAPGSFPYVYSLGVLQHTPHVKRAFAALPPMVKPGGRLCVDFYGLGLGTFLHAKYALRPITKRLPQRTLFSVLQVTTPFMLAVSRALGSVPGAGRFLKRMIPVANYSGVYPLDERQLREWALLDTFDMLAPKYDKPQPASRVRDWLNAADMVDVEVFRDGHLVGRGCKRA